MCTSFCGVNKEGVDMKQKTHISNVLESNNCKDQYDTQVKHILSDKTILAWILKYTTSEFKEHPIDLIKSCIEGEPEVGTRRLSPSLAPEQTETPSIPNPEAITGLDTADKVPGEGDITYDIRFHVLTPTKERIKLIINVEAQKKFDPGYDIVTRGIFYCSRMIAAQKETEFVGSDYDSIKKVYSIWICMKNPMYAQHTITSYHMAQEPLYGTLPRKFRYDLMEMVLVCLGSPESKNKGNDLHGLLDTVLSPNLTPEDKERILTKDYNIPTTMEQEGGLRHMCNLSDLIEEKGIEKGMAMGLEQGKLETLLSLVRDGLLSVEEAAKRSDMTVPEMQRLLSN